jgi:hypothetical protein
MNKQRRHHKRRRKFLTQYGPLIEELTCLIMMIPFFSRLSKDAVSGMIENTVRGIQ